MKYTINTPEGTRDRLFAECRDRRRVQNALTALFRRRSYAEVSTPEVEFYDLFLRSGNPMPQEAMLKIVDRSGRILVMRPDWHHAHRAGGGHQAEDPALAPAALLR